MAFCAESCGISRRSVEVELITIARSSCGSTGIQVRVIIAIDAVCSQRSTAVLALRMTRLSCVSRWIEVIVAVNCAKVVSRDESSMFNAGIALIS